MKTSTREFLIKLGLLAAVLAMTRVWREMAHFPDASFVSLMGYMTGYTVSAIIFGLIVGLLCWGIVALLFGYTQREERLFFVLCGTYLVVCCGIYNAITEVAALKGVGYFKTLLHNQFILLIFGIAGAAAVALAEALPGIQTGSILKLLEGKNWQSMQSSLIEQKNWTGLKQMAMDWLAAEPGNYLALLALGHAQVELCDYEGAAESYDKAVKINPKNPRCWALLGGAHFFLHNYQRALATLMKALELNPSDTDLKEGIKEAIEDCKREIAKNDFGTSNPRSSKKPQSPPMDWKSMGESLDKQKNWAGLKQMAMDWLAAERGNYHAWFVLGHAQYQLGEYAGAVESYDKAVKIDPKDANCWFNLAIAHHQLDNYESALTAYSKALELNPGDPKAKEYLEMLKQKKAKDGFDTSDARSSRKSQSTPKGMSYHYQVLELAPGASIEEIKAAYRRLMQQYHPDKVSRLGKELRELAEKKSKEINEAYQALIMALGG